MKTRIVLTSLLALGLSSSAFAGSITARGSDSTIDTVKALAAAFEKSSGHTATIQGGGSGAGAKSAIAGEVQLAFLSRALHDSETAAGLVGVAYATDAVVVIVHPANPATDLSRAELKGYFTGATVQWPDAKPVVLFNRNADSGTRELFQELVLGKGVEFSPKAALKHDGVLLSSVAKLPTSLAYTSFAHADAAQVKVLAVDGVAPTAESIRSGAYPLRRTPTLATKGEPSGEVKAFIEFVLGPEGQAIVTAHGLLPR